MGRFEIEKGGAYNRQEIFISLQLKDYYLPKRLYGNIVVNFRKVLCVVVFEAFCYMLEVCGFKTR
jgi:hypothetical protein